MMKRLTLGFLLIALFSCEKPFFNYAFNENKVYKGFLVFQDNYSPLFFAYEDFENKNYDASMIDFNKVKFISGTNLYGAMNQEFNTLKAQAKPFKYYLSNVTIIHSDKSDVGLEKYDVAFIPVTIKFKSNNLKKQDFYVAQQYGGDLDYYYKIPIFFETLKIDWVIPMDKKRD